MHSEAELGEIYVFSLLYVLLSLFSYNQIKVNNKSHNIH